MDYHKEFPQDPGICYLNHAAVAPWPIRAQQRVNQFAEENVRRGAQHYPEWESVEHELRVKLCRLINAQSTDDIALVKNTSEALSMVAHGLDWQPGDNVVIPAGEFPSNRIVWQSLERYDVEVRQVDIEACEDPENALFELFDAKTRLLSVSSVRYDTGFALDLPRLGQFCHENDVLFCVDAIQSLGVLDMDVQAIHADFVMADGHKWLLGPEGLAVFYTRSESRDRLKLHEFGWRMVQNPYDFAAQDWEIAQSARRFECGSPNMLSIQALDASLSIFSELGMDAITRNIFKNTSYLIDYIVINKGIKVVTPVLEERHAGIVTFRLQNHDPGDVYPELMKQGVICALRGGGIRFSPHFYTPRQVLDNALGILEDILK